MPQFASLGGITIRLNIAPFLRVDGRGDFFAPLLACLYSDSISLTALAASSSRGGGSGDFSLSPFPLPSALLCLRVSISPPPPGVGCANGRSICVCGRDGDLLASHRVVSLSRLRSFAIVSPAVWVFLSCLVFSCLPGRVSVVVIGSRPRFAPCFPSRAFPTACLLSAPVSSVGVGWLVAPCPPSSPCR